MKKTTFGFIDLTTPTTAVGKIGFTVHEASAATGCQESALQYWSGPGQAIRPAVAVAKPKAPRLPKLFDVHNLVQIKVLTILSTRGLGQEMWRALQESVPPSCWDLAAPLSERLVLVDGTTWHYCAGIEMEVQRQIDRLLTQAADVVVINLTRVKQELRTRLP